MKFHLRAVKYIRRKKSKNLLLGSILFVSLFISLTGLVLQRVTRSQIDAIAASTRAQVIVSSTEMFANDVPAGLVAEILSLENLTGMNRQNEIRAVFKGDLYGMPDGPASGQEFIMTGTDDLTFFGEFSMNERFLETGTLELEGNQALVDHGLFLANEWEIGTKIPLMGPKGEVVEVKITGTFSTPETSFRLDAFQIYTTPDLISQKQEKESYAFVQFLVRSPAQIKQTEAEISALAFDPYGFFVQADDGLFQRLSGSLKSLVSMAEILLTVTVGAAGIVITLLLCLWTRERRREIGLFLSMGIPKASILFQLLLETTLIFVGAFTGMTILNRLLLPHLGSLLLEHQELPLVGASPLAIPEINWEFHDVLQTFGIGALIIVIAITISAVPLFSVHPKRVLSSAD